MHTIGVHLRVPCGDPARGRGDPEVVEAEQAVIEALSAFLSTLPGRPLQRHGNVSAVRLLAGDRTKGRWSLLVMADTDSDAAGLEEGLVQAVPGGSEVMVLGQLGQVAAWPG